MVGPPPKEPSLFCCAVSQAVAFAIAAVTFGVGAAERGELEHGQGGHVGVGRAADGVAVDAALGGRGPRGEVEAEVARRALLLEQERSAPRRLGRAGHGQAARREGLADHVGVVAKSGWSPG